MKMNRDKTLANVQIKGNLTAADMDKLIGELAEARAQMNPSVTQSRPTPKDPMAAGTPISMEDSPAMMAAKLKDGRIRFWARSAGFGWLAFNVIEQDALLIRDYLIANLPSRASDLVSYGSTQQH